MQGQVTVAYSGRLAHIVLDRPARMNAMTVPMLAELAGIVERLAHDDTTDVVLISGAGADFCSGSDVGDIAAVLALAPNDRAAAFESGMQGTIHPLIRALLDLEQVLVVSARGHAIGLGAALLLAADITVLSETVRISIPQVELGHTVDHGESFMLPRKVGLARAMQMVLLGTRLTGADAERIGLATVVVADETLDDTTTSVVSSLLAGSPTSLRGTKSLLSKSLDRDRESQLAAEVTAVSACAFSEDFVAAINAKMGGRRA